MDQFETTCPVEPWDANEISVCKKRCTSFGGKDLFIQSDSLNHVTYELSRLTSRIGLYDRCIQTNADHFETQESIVISLSLALYMRDPNTGDHTIRVTQTLLMLASHLGIAGEDLVDMRHGALLHDIGKLGIPDTILRKPGKLSQDEMVTMKNHPVLGFDLLSKLGFPAPVIDIPLHHHEHWDGSGYPFGLKGGDIPFSARIFSVVDVWDALTSDRHYRQAWPKDKARMYIKSNAGKQFDSRIVGIFLDTIS